MSSNNFRRLSEIAHVVVLCSFIGLISVLIAKLAVEKATIMNWLVGLVPLLIFFPGLVYANIRTHIFLCFVCLLYFMVFVQSVFSNTDNAWAILSIIELVVLFTASMLFARWRSLSQATI